MSKEEKIEIILKELKEKFPTSKIEYERKQQSAFGITLDELIFTFDETVMNTKFGFVPDNMFQKIDEKIITAEEHDDEIFYKKLSFLIEDLSKELSK